MKKKFSAVFTAGALSCAMLMGVTACGGEKLTFDKDAPAFEAPKATITLNGNVDKNDARSNISDTLFGVFLEDINYASYALDDNLLVNSSFETAQGKTYDAAAKKLTNTPTTANDYGWHGISSVVSDRNDGPLGELYKDYNGHYLNGGYATVRTGASGGKLINDGYAEPAMAVTENTEYLFSAFIRNNLSSAAELTLSVKDAKDDTYAQGTLSVPANSGWVKYQKTLTATKTGTEGLRFEIQFEGACDVSLDGVKLETKDSTLGIKNYMYEAVKNLAPKFIRFPGGCVIEGVDMATAYDWKNSVGAVAQQEGASVVDRVPEFEYKLNDEGTETTIKTRGEQLTRRANTDIWYTDGVYYEMEYGIGFYDYFLLCESVGASPVPVLNCGLSDQGGIAWRQGAHDLEGRHGKGTDDYLQDAVDLVYFANGSVNSSDANEAYWAKLRADMGHPEPFGMKYLGIGNEQFGNSYYVLHYQKFVEKFAQMREENEALFGGIELIVGNGMSLNDCQDSTKPSSKGTAQKAAETYINRADAAVFTAAEYGVHDQHYYVNYMDLFTNTKMYDDYARPEESFDGYYNVFVGEYSANSMKSFGDSYTGTSPWANSWITALSEAAMMTAYERNGDIIKLAAYAPMFASVNAGTRQWAVDMMYFTNTDLVLSANYYVQQLFMKNQGKYLLKDAAIVYADGFDSTYTLTPEAGSSICAAAEIDKLYYVASVNGEGDIVLKIVNASGEDIDVNVALNNAKLRGVAKITALQNDNIKAVNTAAGEQVKPEEYTVGNFGKMLGYTAKKYSVTAIVIETK